MIYSTSERSREAAAQSSVARDERAFIRAEGRRLLVSPKGSIIGRSHSCDIALDDVGVSRQHARVIPVARGWAIEDMGSTNGLRINGSPITEPRALRDGDRIELGNSEIVFEVK
jgi:pSer/pThr/pTyr-binding forkhead associated (FHA) protein